MSLVAEVQIVGAGRAHQGRLYTPLVAGKNLLGTQNVNTLKFA